MQTGKKEVSIFNSSADVLKERIWEDPTVRVGNELAGLQDFLTWFAFKKVQSRYEKTIIFQQKQGVLCLLSVGVII